MILKITSLFNNLVHLRGGEEGRGAMVPLCPAPQAPGAPSGRPPPGTPPSCRHGLLASEGTTQTGVARGACREVVRSPRHTEQAVLPRTDTAPPGGGPGGPERVRMVPGGLCMWHQDGQAVLARPRDSVCARDSYQHA